MNEMNDEPRLTIVTIGVYGFSEAAFFSALTNAGVDTFCDIRYRRGVRGSEYAFVNSARLQSRLAEAGIKYLHFRDLAPPPELRRRQTDADKAEGIAKRKRTGLIPAFISDYQNGCLATFDSQSFLSQLGAGSRVAALFCVEREPAACHRSLLAARLQKDLGAEVLNLMPD